MKKVFTILTICILFITISISAEEIQTKKTTKELPTSFSWKNIDGIDYTTPIKNQAPAPTCEAYGLCASLETLMQYQMQELYNPDLSETHLYFYAGGTYEQGYVNLMDAADYLVINGTPDEGCYPDPHRAFDYPFESLSGWENRTIKIEEWGWVEKEVETINNALIEYGPLIICMSIYEDFYKYKEGVYRHKWGKRVGGHVVTIVGYDDNEQCWIVKNSWGDKWGDEGWFKLAYDADIFAEWYGVGTGVMYIDGVHGNFKPDVPRVEIIKPRFRKSYFFGFEFKYIFKKLPIQKAVARLIGNMFIKIKTDNTIKVEFYVDDVLQSVDESAPFQWKIDSNRGFHTLLVKAYNDHNQSIDIVDFYKFI